MKWLKFVFLYFSFFIFSFTASAQCVTYTMTDENGNEVLPFTFVGCDQQDVICPNVPGSLNPHTYEGDLIKWKYDFNVNTGVIVFRVDKCDNRPFRGSNLIFNVREEICKAPWLTPNVPNQGTNLARGFFIANSAAAIHSIDMSFTSTKTIIFKGVIESETNGNFTHARTPTLILTITKTSCSVPSNLNEDNLTENSVELDCNTVLGAVGYRYQYRKVGAINWIESDVTVSRLNVTNLLPCTDYEWRVATKCTSTCISSYSPIQNFTTTGFTLTISPSSNTVNCQQNTINFSVTSSTSYTISSSQSWAVPSPTSGNGNRNVSVNIAQNNTGTTRTATITVYNSVCNITRTYTITQTGLLPVTVNTEPNATVAINLVGYSTTANSSGVAVLNIPCGYTGNIVAAKHCFNPNVTTVSSLPATFNLPLTRKTVTISGTVTPTDANISVSGGYAVTRNTTTGAYSTLVPCDWSGSIGYYKGCFVMQTINHTNVSANLPNQNITLSDDLPSFNLVSPTAFATVSSCTTTLSWTNAGAGVTYQVIAFGTTTSTQYIAAADAETTNTSITINHSSEPVKWFVRAKYPNCQWTPLVNRTFYPPNLTITYPTVGLNLEKGSNQTLTWTSNGLLPTSNVKLELTDLAGVPLITIANSTQNDGTYSWYTSFAVQNGNYRLKISSEQTSLSNCAFDLSEPFVIVSPNCPPVTNPPTGEALTALLYLMENGIINCDQDGTVNQNPIRRYDAAKIFFIGVFGDPYAVTLADNWLTPFADINPVANEPEIQALHRKFARVMTLFEGRNVRTAFDHDRWISFRAEDFIRKKDFIKALLEAFDIEIPTTATGTPYFAEVPSTDAQFRYVQKAKEIGVLNGSETGFNTNISREEAFVFLYRLHTQQALRPSATVLEDKKSFFEFNNYTAENMGEITDASEATMGFAQTVFSISNRGFAATWSFAYSAQRIELPIEFYPHEYMGRGFSYTGNSYVLDLNNLPTNSQRIPTRNRVIVVLESGAIIWFKRENGVLELESEGVYDVELTENTATNTFTFRTKDYITYTFERKGDSKQPFVLTKAQDRYNNFYTLDYEPAQAPATLPYTGYFAYRPTIVRYNNGSTPRFFYYNYIPNKNLIASVHEAGGLTRKAEFGYRTDNDALISYKDPIGHQYLFYYLDQPKAGFTVASTVKHKEYLLSQVRLPNGNVMDNQYSQKRMLSQKTYDDNGNQITTQAVTHYDPKPSEYKTTITIDNPEGGTMNSPTDPPQANDRKYTVEYFPSKNRLRKKVTGPNTDTEYWYNHTAHPTLPSKIRNWNIMTEFLYDARGNLLKKIVSNVGNPTETYSEEWTYNSYNDVLTYKDPDGKRTTNVYTSNGALIRVIPDGGNQYSTLIGRNSWGGVDFIENQFGIRTNFVTDARSGNVTRIYSPLDTLYNEYDQAERLRYSFVIDGETRVSKGKKYVYDLLDRLEIESIIGSQLGNSDSIKLEYERDANGNLLKIINNLGQETVFEYNEHTDYLMSESYRGSTRSRTYYGDGRIESITKTDGTVLHFEFDDTGRITFVRQGIGGTILFTYRYKLYNPNLLDRVIAQDGDYTLYHYNGLNRIKEVITHDASINQNSSIKYQYLASGKLDKMTYPNGLDVTYGYGVNSWLSSVTAWNGASVNYTYARDGKPTEMRYSNGVKTEYIYDDLRRPLIILTRTAANQTISGYRFTYDDFGNIVQERAIEQYNYANLTAKAGQTEYGYGDFNILTSITSPQFGNEQVTQDQNGRRTQKGLHTYSWNTLDQMTATTNGNTGFSATIGYDALGNINSIAKTGGNGNALRRFVWDALGGNPIVETKNTGEAINYYIYGAGMAFKINATTLKVGFYHHDLRGSTIALTNHAGEVSHRYGYGSDMFGELTDVFEPANDAQFFRYNGAYGIMHLAEGWNHNTKTGQLLSMRARWMDVDSGRFLSEDPIWGSNLYCYVSNNPISKIDPKGTYEIGTSAISTTGTDVANISATFLEVGFGSFTLINVEASALNQSLGNYFEMQVMKAGATAEIDLTKLKIAAGWEACAIEFEANLACIPLGNAGAVQFKASAGVCASAGFELGLDGAEAKIGPLGATAEYVQQCEASLVNDGVDNIKAAIPSAMKGAASAQQKTKLWANKQADKLDKRFNIFDQLNTFTNCILTNPNTQQCFGM